MNKQELEELALREGWDKAGIGYGKEKATIEEIPIDIRDLVRCIEEKKKEKKEELDKIIACCHKTRLKDAGCPLGWECPYVAKSDTKTNAQ